MFHLAIPLALAPVAIVPTQVVDTAEGRVEFIGLGKWTPRQLDEAVTKQCEAHYCAADLERELGFAEAAVFVLGQDSVVGKLVVVVEAAERVHKKVVLAGAGAMPPDWVEVSEQIEKDEMALDLALRHYPRLLTAGEDAALEELGELDWAADSLPTVVSLWTFLRAHAAPGDLVTALWHLDHDADFAARRLAAAVLGGFHDQDLAWWALADGLRDADDRVNGTCWTVLRSLAECCARPVDWRPAAPALAAVLAGTQCFAVPDLCRVLAATQVDRSLAPALLDGGGGELVLGFADSQAAFARERARELLLYLGELPATATLEQLRTFVAATTAPAGDRR